MSKSPKDSQEVQDSEVLALREAGRSYSTIAKQVGFAKLSEAPKAFNRALRRRSAAEQDTLTQAETARLDDLELKVRSDKALSADDSQKKLKAVDRLRTLSLAP